MIDNGFAVKDQFKNKTVEELRKIVESDRLPFAVMCLNLTGDLNIGVIGRLSHLMGAEAFFVFGRRKVDNRSFVGSYKYINYQKIDALDETRTEIDIPEFWKFMDDNGYVPVFCEHGGFKYDQSDWKKHVYAVKVFHNNKKMCFVFGNEGKGIPQELMNYDRKNRYIVSIPERGVMRSYNVSSAASIIISRVCSDLTKED